MPVPDPEGKETMTEKRAHPRLPITARVTVAGSAETAYHFTKDISLSGLYLQREAPLTLGAKIELELAIPGLERLIRVQGDVVRAHTGPPSGYGVKFTNLQDVDREALERFLGTAPSS